MNYSVQLVCVLEVSKYIQILNVQSKPRAFLPFLCFSIVEVWEGKAKKIRGGVKL